MVTEQLEIFYLDRSDDIYLNPEEKLTPSSVVSSPFVVSLPDVLVKKLLQK